MLTAGIISEYNPFHYGHASLIRRVRQSGASHVVAVMSGNFVQRGGAALLTKWARARQALLCGADLVVELPLPWALAGAEKFAFGGAALLDALGVDWIAFGSECGEIAPLREASEALASPLLREAMKKELDAGTTFALARQRAVESLFGQETAALLRDPNNILGIEYLKALDRLGSGITPWTATREGTAHDASEADGKFASASKIRALVREGGNCSALMPEESYRILAGETAAGRAPADLLHAERAVLARLRGMRRSEFSSLPDLSEGLENRVCAAVQKACGLEELYTLVKTKRYTLARIRRIAVSAFLGLKAEDSVGAPPYIRVLGIGPNGNEILRRAKEKAALPVISRFSDGTGLGGKAERLLVLENGAADLFALCTPQVLPCGLDRSSGIVVV